MDASHPSSMKAFVLSPGIALVLSLLSSTGGDAQSRLLPLSSGFFTPYWTPTLAQGAAPVQPLLQGNQIILNGRPFSALWSQQQQQIGIADVALMQHLGVELLNTSDVARQPVQWFSQPSTTPYSLSTWLTEQYRFLNITDLSQQLGWQIDSSGSTLRISTPASQITSLRRGRQTWGDRLVLDLDHPTPWRVTEGDEEFTVTVDATTTPTILQLLGSGSGNLIRAVQATTSNNQTVIRVSTSSGLRPYVWTLPDPNRLVIDVRLDSMVERDIAWAPGIRWQQKFLTLGGDRFPTILLNIDPRQPGVTLKPISSSTSSAVGTMPLVTMAEQSQVAAAINGGFFNRNNQLPLGAIRQDSLWRSGPILNRGAIAWNEAGESMVGRLSLQDTLLTSNGQRFPILFFNTGYVGAGVSLYSPAWGNTYTPILDNEVVITVRNNQVISQRNGGAAGQTAIPIAEGDSLIVVRSYQEAVDALPVGTLVNREVTSFPPEFSQFSQILGAGPLLIQNRQIILNAQSEGFSSAFSTQAAVRSVIGRQADGTLILVTIHNRLNGRGPTLQETALLMQQLGVVDALNLDGGSSTSLYLGGKLLNRSSRTAARVHNAIGVFIQPVF